jgi:hypothetical protein
MRDPGSAGVKIPERSGTHQVADDNAEPELFRSRSAIFSFPKSRQERLRHQSKICRRASMLDHIIVTVSDLARSIAFYKQALMLLGITDFLDYDGQDGHPDLKGFGKDGSFFFWLKKGRPGPEQFRAPSSDASEK